jgi:hypothetical protein
MKYLFSFIFMCNVLVFLGQKEFETGAIPEQLDDLPDTEASFGPMTANTYIASVVKYPLSAKRDSIEGTIYVNFFVEPDGRLSAIKVYRSTCYRVKTTGSGSEKLVSWEEVKEVSKVKLALEEAALSAFKQMPIWKPAEKDGVPCRSSRFLMSVKFRLD